MNQIPFRAAFLLSAAAAAFSLAGSAAAVDRGGSQSRGEASEMQARQEIHQTYRIAPNGTVRVRGIAGPVSVETIEGGDTAEVHMVRMAATDRELDCYRTEISSTPETLSIEHVQRRDGSCDNIRSRQEVRLRVPRSVNLDFATIAGALDVAPIDGMVRIGSIAGRTSFARVRAAQINSIAGGLSLGVAPVGSDCVRVDSIVGPVELNLEPGVDADLRVASVVGSVRSLAADIDLEEEDGTYRARLGSGRGRVSLSSVVGSVRLRRP